MVTCKQVVPLSDAFVDGELLAALRSEISYHMRACAECAVAIEGKLGLKRLVRASVKSMVAPIALRDNLRKRIGV